MWAISIEKPGTSCGNLKQIVMSLKIVGVKRAKKKVKNNNRISKIL